MIIKENDKLFDYNKVKYNRKIIIKKKCQQHQYFLKYRMTLKGISH